jgi:hypothetical protein
MWKSLPKVITFWCAGSTEVSAPSVELNSRWQINVIVRHWLVLPQSKAITHQLSTATSRFNPRSGHVKFVVDKSARGQVYSEHFFSLAIHSNACSELTNKLRGL